MEGKITIRINTKNYHGNISKTAHVYSNDPLNPMSRLKIIGKIKELITTEPRRLLLSALEDEDASGKITITNNTDSDMLLEIIKKPFPRLVNLELITVDKGKIYILKATANSRNAINTSITVNIKTNNDKIPLLRLKLRLNIRPVIEARPDILNLGTIKINQDYRPYPRLITISNNGDTPVSIKDIDFDNSVLNVEIKELSPGKRWRLSILPNIQNKKDLTFNKKITLITNHKKHPKIIITVKGKVSHSCKNTR